MVPVRAAGGVRAGGERLCAGGDVAHANCEVRAVWN